MSKEKVDLMIEWIEENLVDDDGHPLVVPEWKRDIVAEGTSPGHRHLSAIADEDNR